MSEGPFKFDINAPRTRVADAEILESLRAFRRHHGRSPVHKGGVRCLGIRSCSAGTIPPAFGSGGQASPPRIGGAKSKLLPRELFPLEFFGAPGRRPG